MSWPVTVYYCTACDFEQGNIATWGTREYVLNSGVRIPVHWHIGWCASCNGIVAVEDLSMAIRMQDYRDAQLELRQFSRGIFGFFKHNKSLEDNRDDAIDALEMLIARKNTPHCLRCLSTDVHELKIPHVDNEEADSPSILNAANQPAGKSNLKRKGNDDEPYWQHHGCQGHIKTKPAEGGLSIALRSSVQRYTPEGLFIGKEFVSGYSAPDGEYYDALSKSNRQCRAQNQIKDDVQPSYIPSFLRID